ncbi:MAG: ABC transporter ATP-binding protein [Rhodospirillales bacterium]|nr:ABC transporter ATP-binding protein [Rhodospirillales bacterium]MSP81032.1 ABC transporter ATP-binding protein [Rhodospirillales bacterium]
MHQTPPASALGRIPRVNVEIRGLNMAYGEAWHRQQVITDLDLDVPAGQMTVVIGPSGCGKSTLVNIIAGFEKPDSGIVRVDGQPVTGPGHDRMVVFQETALMPWLTVRQNVSFGPQLRGEMDRATLRAEADRLIDKVGLREFKDKYPLQLSGGMQRRAELARAMINQPKLMIMDEPFRGLDAMSRELMQEFFLKLFEENRRTNLFVTSEIDEAIFLADRLVVLSTRPATVRSVIEIDLPRPRTYAMLASEKAFDYKREALDILHQEAMKSFKMGSGQSDFLEAYAKRAQ